MRKKWMEIMGCLWLTALLLTAVAFAQEKNPASTATVEQEKEEQEAKEKAKKEEEQAKQPKSVRDSMFSDVRNNATFSIGVSENYSNNILDSNAVKRSGSFTLITPRFVANVQKKEMAFTFDYASGYEIHNRFTELNKTQQSGGATFRYQVTPRAAFQLSDHVSYLPYDNYSALTPSITPGSLPGLVAPKIIFDRQRVFFNYLESNVSYDLSEPTSLYFYGSYVAARYREIKINNYDGFTTGFGVEHKATRKLTLTSGYGFRYYQFNNVFDTQKVHSMTFGFAYKVRPTITLFASGGPEFVTIQGINRVNGYVRSGVSKASQKSTITLGYERGSANYLGVATALSTQLVSAVFDHKFSRRLSGGLNVTYYRSHFLTIAGTRYRGVYGGPRLEYALSPKLAFVCYYNYLRQTSRDFLVGVPNVTRHFVSVGLEYRLPLLFH